MYQCLYEIFNNTEDMLKFFDMSEIAELIAFPVVVSIESEASHKFFGDDINFERICENLKAKCFELGIPNNKQGVYVTISTPGEEDE